MILILLILVLAGLKFFDVEFMENFSWWWITGLFFLAFLWFELFERIFGFDRKKAHEKHDKIQKKRTEKIFKKKK